MAWNRKQTLIRIGLILVVILACWAIGNINISKQASSSTKTPRHAGAQTNNRAVNPLGYCTETARQCVDYFGYDNAGNMLIVLKNYDPAYDDLYAKVKQAGREIIYQCLKVKYTLDTFYCTGEQIPRGTSISIEIYIKSNDRLLASGDVEIIAQESSILPTSPLQLPTLTTKSPTPAITNLGTTIPPSPIPSPTTTPPAYP